MGGGKTPPFPIMLLTEIASNVNIATNNQLSPEQVVLAMDSAQKASFQKNLQAFLVYDKTLTVLTKLTFVSAVYTPAISTDIGKPVVATSGAAILVSYNNTLREWFVSTLTAAFEASGAVSITGGTGAGGLAAEDFQETYKGPYAAPTKITDPTEPCRKIWGVTTREPGQFDLALPPCIPSDYNFRRMFPANQRPFQTGITNDFKKTFTFAVDPSVVTTYYWVYWQNPPDISDLSDSDTLVIPEEYHVHFQQVCIAIAAAIVSNTPFNQSVVEAYMGDWWKTLLAPYRNQQGFQNMTQNPRQGRRSIL